MTKYIVITGGVISGVGKGVVTASLGKIMQEYGLRTTLIKIDPYINYDAGTLRPTEHGEVWVTVDGGEIDQDLGTYERFLNCDIPKHNSITTGQIYKTVIDRERRGEYLGQTVQLIPHITDEISARIKQAAEGYDIAIIEVGGIVGDYENTPFLFALRCIQRELGNHAMVHVLVTYLPIPEHVQEMKTKPAQQAIKLLNEAGISPDFIVCRSSVPLDSVRKKKIEAYAHVPSDCVISAPDIDTIYRVPIELEAEGVGKKIVQRLGLEVRTEPSWSHWERAITALRSSGRTIRIGIVGKYLNTGAYTLSDSYLSIYHALLHAGAASDVRIEIAWISTEALAQGTQSYHVLDTYDGVIVPGGFGASGVEEKIAVIEYVRTHDIPYLGICYGMQLAVIDYARHVLGLHDANTTEVVASTPHPVIELLSAQKALLDEQSYGGTMRIGSYDAVLDPHSRIAELYRNAGRLSATHTVQERHRHRYEVNPAYMDALRDAGLVISGVHIRADGSTLAEFIELPSHPYFVATQAHPEFTSRLESPNPLFVGLVRAAIAHQERGATVTHRVPQSAAVPSAAQ